MVRETIVLTRRQVADEIDVAQTIPAIEACFAEFEKGGDLLPPKYIVPLPLGIAACIFGYTKATHLLTMKLGQERKSNLQRSLPTIMGTLQLYDPDTGELLMIVESVLATMYRTGAAAAVGAKHLSRPDARVLAVVGAGQLGRQVVRAVATVRQFERIYVTDALPKQAERLVKDLAPLLPAPIEQTDPETACRAADVIVTATNSTEPIVQSAWVKPGTHLSCMGADLHEKIECETGLLRRCRLFADNIEHCLARGEVSQAVASGVLGQDCFAGSLGRVINGDVAGRTRADEITLFDAVGLGVQDTTIAKSIFDQAVAKNLGIRIGFC